MYSKYDTYGLASHLDSEADKQVNKYIHVNCGKAKNCQKGCNDKEFGVGWGVM